MRLVLLMMQIFDFCVIQISSDHFYRAIWWDRFVEFHGLADRVPNYQSMVLRKFQIEPTECVLRRTHCNFERNPRWLILDSYRVVNRRIFIGSTVVTKQVCRIRQTRIPPAMRPLLEKTTSQMMIQQSIRKDFERYFAIPGWSVLFLNELELISCVGPRTRLSSHPNFLRLPNVSCNTDVRILRNFASEHCNELLRQYSFTKIAPESLIE